LLDVQGQFVGKSVGVTKDERFVTFTETAAEGNIWLANFPSLDLHVARAAIRYDTNG
jgi:hypothetical protein